jgi:stage II sporulation protein D
MRIAIGQELRAVALGGPELRWAEDDEQAPYTLVGRSRAVVTLVDGQLAIDGELARVDALRFRAGPEEDAPISASGMSLRGDVVVSRGQTGLVTVNVLGLEDYLVGVLGSEMPRSFPVEALRAQAVAARTYALNKKLEQYGRPFHLGSTVISQVYRGLEAEDPRTREAVESTRGLVLTWQLQPIEAYFHASCGGRTEAGAEALGRDLPYLKSVNCPCGALPGSHWSLKVPTQELTTLFGARAASVRVEGRTAGGRVRRIVAGPRTIDAVAFRARLGYTRVRSLDFKVKPLADGVELTGSGFGHGAGLCQWGARLKADKGWDFRRILLHYYPGSELQTLY